VAGTALAEGQQVKPSRHRQRRGHPDRRERQRGRDGLPSGPVQAPELPEDDLLPRLGVRDEREERDDRERDRVHCDPGEHQRDHFGAPVGPRQRVHQQRRDQAGGERGDRHGPAAEDLESQHDDRAGADCRAGRHTDEGGLGQRVPEHALHERTCAGQRGTHDDRERHPREPHEPQRALPLRMGRQRSDLDPEPVEDRSDHLVGRDAHLAVPGGHDRDRHECDREPDQQRHAGSAAAPREPVSRSVDPPRSDRGLGH
jgi:hypothetical protein